jgi:hypothetical protein
MMSRGSSRGGKMMKVGSNIGQKRMNMQKGVSFANKNLSSIDSPGRDKDSRTIEEVEDDFNSDDGMNQGRNRR